MVMDKFIELAEQLREEVIKNKAKSCEIYFSVANTDGDYTIEAFDGKGRRWEIVGGGEDG